MTKLPPQIREALDYLWANLPAVPWERIPDHLHGAACHLETHKPRWARNVDIDGVLHVELVAAGAAALEADRLYGEHEVWGEPRAPAEWRKLFKVSDRTLQRWVASGKLTVDKVTPKLWRIRRDCLERFAGR